MPSPPLAADARPSSTKLSPDALGANRAKEGRTPPPAQSAAFARQSRDVTGLDSEMNGDADLGEVTEEGPTSAGGLRRARAGTLPSSFQNAEDEAPPSISMVAARTQDTPVRTSALSPAYPAANAGRPTLRHTASSSAQIDSPSQQPNRVRSGSLTLPSQNPVGQAFGSSVFPWLNDSTSDSTDSQLPNSDSQASLNLVNVNTLDYLGLADASDLPPASMSELRNQAQRKIANYGPASRLRASTISSPRSVRQSVINTPPRNQYDDQNEEVLADGMDGMGIYDNEDMLYGRGGGAYGYGAGSYGKDVHRPRATTIGTLDNNRRFAGAQSGYLSSIPQSPVQGNMGHSHNLSSGYAPRRENSRDRAPRMAYSSQNSRTNTPDILGSSTPQLPTRSLWIGNLDVNATSDALLHVFAPYGAIESVRMLPEKTCAFVNFMEKGDAIRARDDVLNRMGGHVTALSETAPVRIGFGKIDAVPAGNGPPVNGRASSAGSMHNANPSNSNTPIPPVPPLPAHVTNPPMPTSPDPGAETSTLPTRALWIGSIPGTTSSATLLQIFSPFGPVESARVLMHKCCGFVNFERLDSAVAARNALNGRDILGSDVGPIRIGFARVPTRSPALGGPEEAEDASPKKLTEQLATVTGAASVSTEQQLSAEGGGLGNYRSQLVVDLVKSGVHEQLMEKGLSKDGVVTDQQMIMSVLSGGREEEDGDVKTAADPRPTGTYYTTIPAVADRSQRRFDPAKLKDIRKKLDSGLPTSAEIDQISLELMEDCAELSSDYIGNTIIQKLFERCSPDIRMAMLERIAPHLAMIGVHKNGTWAAQKVIECSQSDEERNIVVSNLRPFAPPLMCDSLGNYVCAGTLRFGSPASDYVYDAMIDRMWDIAQNRFGARCMRTCLESPHTSLYQKKRISASIILNSIPLATNPNGALLLTWLVDQSNLPGRYGLLANRFAPHIAHLCTHKLASLTVLRVMSQNAERTATTTLFNAIFASSNDNVLTEILSDPSNGAQVVGKMLVISCLTAEEKQNAQEACRRVLPSIKASSTPPYRSLLEAVGLPVPAGHMNANHFGGRGTNNWSSQQHPTPPQAAGFGYYPYQAQASPNPALAAYGPMGQNLSPLLVPQNMPLGQANRNASPKGNASPHTPNMRQRGRLSPASHMMSPGSDPFNPFASPSIDMPYYNQGGVRVGSSLSQPPVTFEPQPNVGGLGILGQQNGQSPMYYGQHLHAPSGMYAAYRT